MKVVKRPLFCLKRIAQRWHLGSATYVSNRLNEQSQTQPQAQVGLPLIRMDG
jgi:hypothetical protein